MRAVFHRAFDMARDLPEALETVIRAGCARILTSGGCNTAEEGLEPLRGLVRQAAGRIEIMAGSGVNPANVGRIAATGIDAVHFSARSMRESGMTWRNPAISMGGVPGIPEFASPCADEGIVRRILCALDACGRS